MCDENRVDVLSGLIANLRDVFPFPSDVDLAEIVHSPEYCLEAMIRHFRANSSQQIWRHISESPKGKSIFLLPNNPYYYGACVGDYWFELPEPPAGSP